MIYIFYITILSSLALCLSDEQIEKIKLTTDDADYADNPLEIDAMWFEKRYAKKALDLYFALKKAKVKNVT